MAPSSALSTTNTSRKSSYAWATPAIVLGQPFIFISAPAGPETAAPPTIGLTAATGAFALRKASRIPGTARIGPMLVTGLLGAKTIASADAIALQHARRRPGASRRPRSAPREPRPDAARAQNIPETSACLSRCRAWWKPDRRTWAARARECRTSPPVPPSLRSSVFPARSSAVRVRWVARSRSPRLNHAGWPSCFMRSRQRKLSPSTPQPRSLLSSPESHTALNRHRAKRAVPTTQCRRRC